MVARAKRRMRARRGESEAKAKAKRKRSERARRIERASTTGLYTYRSKEEICEMDVGADGTETLESSCIGFRGSVVGVARGGKRQVRFSGTMIPDRRGRCATGTPFPSFPLAVEVRRRCPPGNSLPRRPIRVCTFAEMAKRTKKAGIVGKYGE